MGREGGFRVLGEVGLVEMAPWEGMVGGKTVEGEGGKGGRGEVVVGWRVKGAVWVGVAGGGKREGCSVKGGGEVKGEGQVVARVLVKGSGELWEEVLGWKGGGLGVRWGIGGQLVEGRRGRVEH